MFYFNLFVFVGFEVCVENNFYFLNIIACGYEKIF